MAQNTKASETPLKKPRKKRKDNRIEKEYFEEVEIIDPQGNKIVQKVKITRYKTIGDKPVGNKGIPSEEIEYEED